jgi:hypothetical protein
VPIRGRAGMSAERPIIDSRLRRFVCRRPEFTARWLLRMRDEHVGKWHLVPGPPFTCAAMCGTWPEDIANGWKDAHAGAYVATSVCKRCFQFERRNGHNVMGSKRRGGR